MENLSARDSIDVNLYTINPKGIVLLGKPEDCFSFSCEDGDLELSDYSETLIDPTFIKIHAKLSDASEGYRITISGCLWPENRTTFSEDQLRESYPELFYSTSFIQNTPPDNIKNMTVPKGESAVIDGRHYVSFDVPAQDLNRNKDSTYEIKYYLNEGGSLNYKGSRILTLDDNKNPTPGSSTFFYYFDGQEPSLYYDYTVQVIGPRGLRSEIFSTAPGLGVVQVSEPVVTVTGLNGLKDDEGFECVEVENESDIVSFTAVTASEDDTLTVTVDGSEVTAAGYRVSGIGQHTIVATSSRDGSRPISVTKKIRIIESLKDPVFSCNKLTGNSNGGYEYIEISAESVGVSYSITSANPAGCTITGTDSCTPTSGSASTINFDSSTGSQTNSVVLTLGLGDHIITGTVHNPLYKDHSFTKKLRVVHELQKPTIKFYKESAHSTQINKKSGNPEDTRYLLYDTYNITLAADGTGYLYYTATTSDGSTITIKDDGTTTTSGKLGLGPHNLTMEVSKTNYVTRTFDTPEKVYVEGILAPAKIQYSATKSESTKVWTDMANSTSTQNLLFSYISYDKMPVKVSPGNTGNEIAVSLKMNGSVIESCGNTTSDFEKEIGHGSSIYTITVNQSREYCITSETATRKFSAKIKPVTLRMQATSNGELSAWITGLGKSNGEVICIRGQVLINEITIFHWKNSYLDGVVLGTWTPLRDTDFSYSQTFSAPSDTITLTIADKFRRDKDGSDLHIIDGDETISRSTTLEYVRTGKNNGSESDAGINWTFICDTISNRDGTIRPRVIFTASD